MSMNEVEKLDRRSIDIAAERREELLRLFPEVRTEGPGQLDFDRLKLALDEAVDMGKERYGMTWPGKADCFITIQAPSLGTLLPCPEESINFETTENLIIEGDNLEMLKLLQKSYLGKVKMIYIDPPYNTGKDFIYPDKFAESLRTYLEYTGQLDAEGRKFGTNTDTEGRFHSRWLNMMYPRLYLARNLLREDGVVSVSFDEKELPNLLRILDEVFGEENRVGVICWKNVTDNNPTLITTDNEFIICYARSTDMQPKLWSSGYSAAKDLLIGEYERLKAGSSTLAELQEGIRQFIADNEEAVGFLSRYRFVDAEGIYTGSESVHKPRPGGYVFDVHHPTTGRLMRSPANGYRFPESTFRQMDAESVILCGADERRTVKIKKYVHEYEDSLRSVLTLDGRLGSYELKRLFPDMETMFTNPKPTELLETLGSFATDDDSLIVDLFAGRGTVGDAVLALNRRDNGNRKFILVQLPEPTGRDDYPTIADITQDRVRRAVAKMDEANNGKLTLDGAKKQQDRGFRVFKLAQSNFTPWDAEAPQDARALTEQLELHISHIKEGRTAEDILYELLLKSGFPLTTSVEKIELAGKTVYSAPTSSEVGQGSDQANTQAILTRHGSNFMTRRCNEWITRAAVTHLAFPS